MTTKINWNKQDSDKRTGVGTTFHYGKVTIDTQGFDEESFEFSLCEMNDKNSGSSSTDVTWIDKTPKNPEAIQTLINDSFSSNF